MSGTQGEDSSIGRPAASSTGSSGASSIEERLAERYGRTNRPKPGQRVAVATIAVLVAAAVTWWTWVAVVRSDPAVSWQVVGYDIVSSTSVEVRWTVDRDPQAQVECVLRARDRSGSEVGRDRVTVPAGGAEGVEMRATVKTSDRPVTGEVLSCLPVSG